MESMNILALGPVRHRQRCTQCYDHVYLGLHVRGLEYWRFQDTELIKPGPFFSMGFEQEVVTFEFNEHRENWVAIMDCGDLQPGPVAETFLWRYGEYEVSIPRLVMVPEERVAVWQEELFQLQEAFQNPTPGNLLFVQLGVMNMLKYMLAHKEPLHSSPAYQLKHLINDKTNEHRRLAELSADCGYTADYLRSIFTQTFGISPQAYRMRRRMSRAMELMTSTPRSLKEISFETGFKHQSHFSALFRKTYGVSAREMIKKIRQGMVYRED